MEEKKGGHGQGGRGGAAVNRFPNIQKPTQRPTSVEKGASNKKSGGSSSVKKGK